MQTYLMTIYRNRNIKTKYPSVVDYLHKTRSLHVTVEINEY